MFRSSLIKNTALRRYKPKKSVLKEKWEEFDKKMRKMKDKSIFSPEEDKGATISDWYTPKRISVLAKAYEKMKNTNPITHPINKKDQKKLAEFKIENQYHEYKRFLEIDMPYLKKEKRETMIKNEIETLPYKFQVEILKDEGALPNIPYKYERRRMYLEQGMYVLPKEVTYKELFIGHLEDIHYDKTIA